SQGGNMNGVILLQHVQPVQHGVKRCRIQDDGSLVVAVRLNAADDFGQSAGAAGGIDDGQQRLLAALDSVVTGLGTQGLSLPLQALHPACLFGLADDLGTGGGEIMIDGLPDSVVKHRQYNGGAANNEHQPFARFE